MHKTDAHPSAFNDGKPYHGSSAVKESKLRGKTDQTDYFYFLCPFCADNRIMQILDFGVTMDGPVAYDADHRSKARRDFTIAFKIYCSNCKLTDFVKVSNTGWQGGNLSGRVASPLRLCSD